MWLHQLSLLAQIVSTLLHPLIDQSDFVDRLEKLKSTEDTQPEFHIKPSKKTYYKYLTAVMSNLQK